MRAPQGNTRPSVMQLGKKTVTDFRPLPDDWIYRPANPAANSTARAYFGYQADRRFRLLRPGSAVKLNVREGDLVNLTNTDGATRLWLLTFDNAAVSYTHLTLPTKA